MGGCLWFGLFMMWFVCLVLCVMFVRVGDLVGGVFGLGWVFGLWVICCVFGLVLGGLV